MLNRELFEFMVEREKLKCFLAMIQQKE